MTAEVNLVILVVAVDSCRGNNNSEIVIAMLKIKWDGLSRQQYSLPFKIHSIWAQYMLAYMVPDTRY